MDSLRTVILTYIFSLRKENRQLHKRLNDRQFIENPVQEAERQLERKYLRDEDKNNSVHRGLTNMTAYKRPAIGEGIGNFAEYKELIANEFPHAQKLGLKESSTQRN